MLETLIVLGILILGVGLYIAFQLKMQSQAISARDLEPPVVVVESVPDGIVVGEADSPFVESVADVVVVGDSDDPFVEISLSQNSGQHQLQAMDLPAEARKELTSLLGQSPKALVAGAQLAEGTTRLVMVFKPSTARALASGTAELVPSSSISGAMRGMARAKDGKRIISHANLLRKVNPVALAAAAWQVASIITAQAYLADITKSLNALEEGVDDIKDWLEDEVVAKMQANIEYLHDWFRSVNSASTTPAEYMTLASQVKTVDREGRAHTKHLLKTFENHAKKVSSQDWKSGGRSTDDEQERAKDFVERAKHIAKLCSFSFEERRLALQVRGAMELSGAYTAVATRSLEEDRLRLKTAWDKFEKEVSAHVPSLRATFQWGSTDKEDQQKLSGTIAEVSATVKENLRDGDEALAAIEGQRVALLQARAEPMTWEVDVDQTGRILSTYHRVKVR